MAHKNNFSEKVMAVLVNKSQVVHDVNMANLKEVLKSDFSGICKTGKGS